MARSARPPSARRYLAERTQLGVKFGLESMRALLEALDHPERAAPVLLVAGTNGKGSVAAYAEAALLASGLRTGLYTSPHLVDVRERIVVDGAPLTPGALERAVSRVREAAERLVAAGRIPAHPTYFETLTLAAFEHFRAACVEVAVVEVGLGGRLDATNASEPLVSAIVGIDRDHEEFLGTSLAAIASEKAGVLRPGRTTVLGPLAAEARAAIAARAQPGGARLVDALHGVSLAVGPDERIDLRTPAHAYAGLRPLPGVHQRANLVVAVRLLEEAAAAGLPLDLDRVGDGIERTRWPGRLQWLPGPPPLLLDGAHNAAGARALAEYLRGRPLGALVFAAMADKAVEEMAEALFPLARHVVLTRLPLRRAATTVELALRGGRFARTCHRRARVRQALALARSLAAPGEAVVVAGSLYLVGAVLGLLQRDAGARPGPFGCG